MQEFIALANTLADTAGQIVKQYYRVQVPVEVKADASPVTMADRAVETAMRDIIEKFRPDDGILGEEFGHKETKSGYTWVLDPIDGTKPFICGRPTFGTLIALCDENGVPVLGLIDQPILNDRWVGVTGQITTHNGTPVKTRPCPDLSLAVSSATAPGMFDEWPGFIPRWRDEVNFISWGGDCISYGLLANGHIDVIIEANMQVYDYLSCVPIVVGAGGYIRDFQDRPLTLHSQTGTVIAIGDTAVLPRIQEKILI